MNDILALAGRALVSPIFLIAGYDKLMAPDGTKQFFGSLGLPVPDITYWVVIAFELGAGLALLLGFRVRTVGLLLAAFSLATGFLAANVFVDWGQWINFFKNVAMAGGLLFIAAHGAGRYSLDAMQRTRLG